MAVSHAMPARFVFVILGFLGFFNAYAMRVNLSVAIVAMVKKTVYTNQSLSETSVACPNLLEDKPYGNDSTINSFSSSTGEFEWNTHVQGIVLGAFYYGYVLTQIPGGLIAERYGGKLIFGIGMLLTSIATLLVPLAARWSVWALVTALAIEGLGEGVMFPAINTLIGQWAPKLERSRITAFIFTGSNIGNAFTMAVSGVLCNSDFLGGWPSVFYIFGTLGCLWLIPWALLVFETPNTHPRISTEELMLIQQGKNNNQPRGPVPWKSLFTSLPLYMLFITHIGESWGLYTLLIEIPMYLSNILHFNLKENGLLSAVPSLMLSIVTIVASIIADKMRASGRLKITTIRKIINSIGFFGPAICLAAVAFIGCRPTIIVAVLTLALGINGFAFSGFIPTYVDMSPEFSGTLYGISSFFANCTGFLVPAFVGWMIQDGQTVKSWGTVFISASAMFLVTGIIYDVFCSAELQPWGVHKEDDKEDEADSTKIDSYPHPLEQL